MTLKNSEIYNYMRHNIFSMAHLPSAIPESSNGLYRAREPHGKRSASNFEGDSFDYGPKAKKRFERVNSMLHDFSISNDKPFIIESDDDMGEYDASCSPTSPVIVEEPEDIAPSCIELNSALKGYLERAKQTQNLLPSSLNSVRGDEVAIWRPLQTLNPLDDPSMAGRITEVEEEDNTEDYLDYENVVDTPTSSTSEMSTDSSPRNSPQIVELSDDDLSLCSRNSGDSMEVDMND